MSYLQLPGGVPNFSKAVISLWFRIPQSSIDAANAAYNAAANTNDPIPPLVGIIPLVTMGKKGESQDRDQTISQAVSQRVINRQTISDPGTSSTSQSGTTTITITENLNIGYIIGSLPDEVSYKTVVTTYPTDIESFDPVCIGVDCTQMTGGGKPAAILYVHFETSQRPEVTNHEFDLRSIDPAILSNPGGGDIFFPPFQSGTRVTEYTGVFLAGVWVPIGPGTVISDTVQYVMVPGEASYTPAVYNYVDVSNVFMNRTGVISSDTILLNADQWHHVLISVELTDIKVHGYAYNEISPPGGTTDLSRIDSTARLFVALDDNDYIGSSLSENWPAGLPDLHGIITDDAFNIMNESANSISENPDAHGAPITTGQPQYLLSGMYIPSSGQPMGLPAPSEWVNQVHHVEMAEFQMFTNVTTDTGIEANRRAFLDFKRNKDGHVISAELFPVNPTQPKPGFKKPPAEVLLGKPPDILLHRSSLWIAGKNTGSLGIGKDGKPIASGQFKPTGTIKRYKPDPSINPSAPSPARAAKKMLEGVG